VVSNNQTLEDIARLQKIFTKNPNLFVSDFQGLIGEDGQLHIMDPQGVNLHSDSENNASQLDILQGVRQNIFKHHKRFTDKTLNHIVYIDKKLWDSPDDAFKQKRYSFFKSALRFTLSRLITSTVSNSKL
jgi:filamentous hemagglutinin family protein